jgi:hypothetical protein
MLLDKLRSCLLPGHREEEDDQNGQK